MEIDGAESMRLSGVDVLIKPDKSLVEMARTVSSALGVSLEEETTGKFEEFPAYVGEKGGVEYALLAPPLPEHDIRENPTDDYCLQILAKDENAVVPTEADVARALRAVGLQVS